MERSRSGRNGMSNIDTHIPSYGGPPKGDDGLLPPLPRGRDDSRGWDSDRDRDYYRDRYRDRDWNRRDRLPRDGRGYVRKRSRSPFCPCFLLYRIIILLKAEVRSEKGIDEGHTLA